MSVIILKSDDWQGFFIDGVLIDEGHVLGEGNGLINFLQEKSKIYNFKLEDIQEFFTTEEDDKKLDCCGCFPDNIKKMHGEYK